MFQFLGLPIQEGWSGVSATSAEEDDARVGRGAAASEDNFGVDSLHGEVAVLDDSVAVTSFKLPPVSPFPRILCKGARRAVMRPFNQLLSLLGPSVHLP